MIMKLARILNRPIRKRNSEYMYHIPNMDEIEPIKLLLL